jgi:hypothetical protein
MVNKAFSRGKDSANNIYNCILAATFSRAVFTVFPVTEFRIPNGNINVWKGESR